MAVAPIVMPPNVTVTATLAATLPDCSVSTMFDAPLAPELKVTPLKVTVGVTPEAKKLVGYVSVTVLVDASAPPTVGVKLNVAATSCLFTTRSELAMLNPTPVTAPPICPDGVLADGKGS